ncbi:MAG: transcriptional regulator, partial [Betaproteobacteria bacterium]
MSTSAHDLTLSADCRFGRFELQPVERRLLADGHPVALGARAFDLLLALVARAGQLVSKNELLTQVWPGLVVEENNLQVQVSALRKLLGQSSVSTIPGRGYRFELPLERLASAQAPPLAATIVATSASPVAPARAPTNLPPRQATLYGRATDVAAVKALLAQHPVVTIAGAGGIGKTRVAQAVAAQLAEERMADFPDGVWWVELAPIADGA